METSGLYYYRARHYAPSWGRFLQTDPIGDAGGPLLYAYVGNDPLNLVDPDGLFADRAVNFAQGMFRLIADPETPKALVEAYIGANIFAAAVGGDLLAGALTGGAGSALAAPLAVAGATVGTGLIIDAGTRLGGAIDRAFDSIYLSKSVGDSSGSSNAPKLTDGGRRALGNLSGGGFENRTVADAIRARGGTTSNVNNVSTDLQQLSVAEVANRAAQGDEAAKTAIKTIKQAARLGQKY